MSDDTIDVGGPTFPTNTANVNAPGACYADGGMMLREYFMAHAPAEPQPWFTPVAPMPRPTSPQLSELSTEDRADYHNQRLDYEPDKCSAALHDFVERSKAALQAQHAWDADMYKQRYVQWPGAWADEMIKRRATR